MAEHVLAIPAYLHAHITTMLRLTTQLARKGITISFVCFEDAVPGLTSGDISSELLSINFRFVTVPHPALPEHSALVDLPRNESAKLFKQALEPLMGKFVHDKSSGLASPTSIISDMTIPWAPDVAEKMQIPIYMLIVSGAICARYSQGVLENFESGKLQISQTDGKLIESDGFVLDIDGLPPLHFHELGRFLREDPADFRLLAESVMKSRGLLVNSFFELEERVIERFQFPEPGLELTKAPKIYPIGPLSSINLLINPIDRIGGLEDSSSECLHWLSSQPSSSVLYIAFGSINWNLPPEQINEMAHGLEASDQRFLWVLPPKKMGAKEETASITDVLPKSFEARVGDRGCIVTSWAPQLQILAHASTGGFMTHSGGNSILESITFGVPMICWPQGADQFLNCRYLVDDLKIAEEIKRGNESFVERKEIERAVRVLMVESEGKAMRSRVQDLKMKAATAIAEGGSQSRYFQKFLDDIHNH